MKKVRLGGVAGSYEAGRGFEKTFGPAFGSAIGAQSVSPQ